VALSAVVLAICAVTVYVLLENHLRTASDTDLLEELDELALEVRLAERSDQLLPDLEERFGLHGEYRMRVDKLGEPWTFEGGPSKPWDAWPAGDSMDAQTVWRSVTSADGREWRVVGTHIQTPSGNYAVQVAASESSNRGAIQSLMTALLITAPCALLLTAAAGYVTARQALAPIRTIARTAERVSGASLGERIPEPAYDNELGQLVHTLNDMLTRLQAALEQMRRFTADAAHELRTPLAVVTNEVEVLLRAPRSVAEHEQSARHVLQEVHRLTQIVAQLLALSRLDAGLGEDGEDEVRLDALLTDVVDQCRKGLTQANASLELAADSPCWVRGDDIQLSRLFFNLIDNALHSCAAGGRVMVSARNRQEQVQITVADNGAGIAAAELPRVFQRFYRGASGKGYAGSGLGLSICEAVVTAHRGRIAIESEPGQGTTVTVTLPASAGELDASDSETD